MSVLCFFTEEKFNTGELVCINTQSGKAVKYNDKFKVIGVALSPLDNNQPNGRMYYNINGITYYENDQYIWNDDLLGDFMQENIEYIPYNPLNSEGYVSAIVNGMSAVLKTEIGIPSDWILLKEKENYYWYLVR